MCHQMLAWLSTCACGDCGGEGEGDGVRGVVWGCGAGLRALRMRRTGDLTRAFCSTDMVNVIRITTNSELRIAYMTQG